MRAGAIAYLLLLLIMMWLETTLIFPTMGHPARRLAPGRGSRYEDVFFTSADGTRLHGWYFDQPGATAYVLYCHGNGEDVAGLGEYMDALRDRHRISLFAFDFRGYGRSAGRPEERGIIADACAAQQWLAQRAGVSTTGHRAVGTVDWRRDRRASGGRPRRASADSRTHLHQLAGRGSPPLPVVARATG